MPNIKKARPVKQPKEKSTRGNAAQFFVAGELCRRGYCATVTLGNNPNTDILCSNLEGTKFVHIQVKTYRPGDIKCTVGRKAEKFYGKNFFWVISGIPESNSDKGFKYYIIPSSEMSKWIKKEHNKWMKTPGKNNREHQDSGIRVVGIPPYKDKFVLWDITKYENNWGLIESKLRN